METQVESQIAGIDLYACGCDHDVDSKIREEYVVFGRSNGRVPHDEVVEVTQNVWGYEEICRFFDMRVEDAAKTVAGAVQPDYPFAQAVAITAEFTKTWQGCPEESCAE